jgi:hypothetical protein
MVSAKIRPLYRLEKEKVHVQQAGWVPGPVWTGAENLPPPEFDPRTVQPVADRYGKWLSTFILPGWIFIFNLVVGQ